MSADDPYLSPVNDTEPHNIQMPDQELATLGQRFLGSFIDTAIVIVPLVGIVLLLEIVFVEFDFEKLSASPLVQQLIEEMFFGLLYAGAYTVINWVPMASTGQTWGKKVMKIRMVTMSGQKPRLQDLIFKRCVLISVLGALPKIGIVIGLYDMLRIFRRDRRCLHDIFAGTKVVKVKPGEVIG